MIVRDSPLAGFGFEIPTPTYATPATAPGTGTVLVDSPKAAVVGSGTVLVPDGYTSDTWGKQLASEEPSFLDQIGNTLKSLFSSPPTAQPLYGAPVAQKTFFQTPAGLAVAVTGGVAVLGMTYFLFKPQKGAPVAIYNGYGRKSRRKRRSKRSR